MHLREVSSRDRSKIGSDYILGRIETLDIFKRTVQEQILFI